MEEQLPTPILVEMTIQLAYNCGACGFFGDICSTFVGARLNCPKVHPSFLAAGIAAEIALLVPFFLEIPTKTKPWKQTSLPTLPKREDKKGTKRAIAAYSPATQKLPFPS